MKKVVVLLFVVLSMILSLFGCGNPDMAGTNDVVNIDKSVAVENASSDEQKLSAVDWSEFKFTLEGEALQLPFYVSELESLGWKVGKNTFDYRKYKLQPGDTFGEFTFLINEKYSSDLFQFNIEVGNYSDKRLRGSKCAVSSLSINTLQDGSGGLPNFVINGGIGLGSTYEEIVTVFGEPRGSFEFDDGRVSMTYETKDMSRCMELSLDADGRLSDILFILGVDTNIPVTGTSPVTEEDTPIKWSDFKFTLDGNRLQIPFAVSELTEQGWYPREEELDLGNFTLYPGESSMEIVMEHDRYAESNDSLASINLANRGDGNLLGQDCEVRRLYIRRNHGTNIPELVLDGDIMIGDTLEDVIDAYGEPAKVGEYDDGDKLLVYLNENATREMKLYIDAWEGITIIELCDYEGTQKAEEWHWVNK